jgi:hypothetical protein
VDLRVVVVVKESTPHLGIVTFQIWLHFIVLGCRLAAQSIWVRDSAHYRRFRYVFLGVVSVHISFIYLLLMMK